MDFDTYRRSIEQATPPAGLGMAAQAPWWEAKGDWHQAHKCAQQQGDPEGAWVHAYLHRVGGDLGNAGYWYRRAGQPVARDSLEAEWERIVAALIGS